MESPQRLVVRQVRSNKPGGVLCDARISSLIFLLSLPIWFTFLVQFLDSQRVKDNVFGPALYACSSFFIGVLLVMMSSWIVDAIAGSIKGSFPKIFLLFCSIPSATGLTLVVAYAYFWNQPTVVRLFFLITAVLVSAPLVLCLSLSLGYGLSRKN